MIMISSELGMEHWSCISFMLHAFAPYSGTKTRSNTVVLPQCLAMDGVDSSTSAPCTQSQKAISQGVFLIRLC